MNVMKASEILSSFLKNNEVAKISEKQQYWLLSQLKSENVEVKRDGVNIRFYFEGVLYKISNCYTHFSAYGGLVGKKAVPGICRLEKTYHIRFSDTGIESIENIEQIERIKAEGYKFTFISK